MILLMGIAGAGKGTQGQLLADKHGYYLLSMGDAVRQYATDKQREKMLAGVLLDDNDVIAIIDEVLRSLPEEPEIILDGFPRTIPQAEWLLEQVQAGRFVLRAAVHLVASPAAVKQRLEGRGRVDDVEGAIQKRFEEYERSTKPLLDWLRDHGVAVIDINAERSVQAVNQDIVSHLKD